MRYSNANLQIQCDKYNVASAMWQITDSFRWHSGDIHETFLGHSLYIHIQIYKFSVTNAMWKIQCYKCDATNAMCDKSNV